MSGPRRTLAGRLLAVLSTVLTLAVASPAARPAAAAPTNPPAGVPLFAFYYIWFDPSSWDRAKIDYPVLGRYSSDDPRVMAQQIQWAKSAGIDGFIVSWKDTTTNDRRLRLLMDVAGKADFKLAMIYQGLDFNRNPLPAAQVATDLQTFRDQFASDPVFYRLGGKPLTIWSGTWAFSHADVARATEPVRGSIRVLNTEKSLTDYQRIADVTDGDAYYWSSVNPDTNPNYGTKLNAMSQAIRADGKYWIAPFAPGFDARLVGGTSTVDRRDGQTLRTEYAAAVGSSPDVLGLISWNEFSENSYVEPSQKFGHHYLDVLRQLRSTPVPPPTGGSRPPSGPPSSAGPDGDPGAGAAMGPDSSDSPPRAAADASPGAYWSTALLVGFPVGLAVVVGLLSARRRRRAAMGGPDATPVGRPAGST